MEAILEQQLAAITVPDIRGAFPAHEALSRCHLIYSAEGVGHLRELGPAGPRLLCGEYGDPRGASHIGVRGEEAVHRAECEACANEGLMRRNAAEAEHEDLRFALRHVNAIASVLRELQGALR